MRVIKRHEENAPSKWKRMCVCGNCKSLLETEENDLTLYYGVNPRTERVWRYIAFRCGACNRMNEVGWNYIPTVVEDRVTHFNGLPSGGCEFSAIILEHLEHGG